MSAQGLLRLQVHLKASRGKSEKVRKGMKKVGEGMKRYDASRESI